MPSTIPLRSVMTTDVVTVTAGQTLAEAADVLAERGIGAAPVVDDAGKVVGLLRDEDLLSTEARLHVPTTIAILGVNFTLPGQVAALRRGAAQGDRLDGRRGDGAGVPAAAARRERSRTRPRSCTRPTSRTWSSWRTAARSVSWHGATSSATSLAEHVSSYRPTRVEIDLDAIRHNVGVLRDLVAPAAVLAVVKADAYGHGAVPVARAAVEAGASALGVALVEEGVELRDAGIDAPILVLSEPRAEAARRGRGPAAHAGRLHRGRASTRSAKAVAEPGRGRRSRSTSRSTPACTAWGPSRTTRSRSAAACARPPRAPARRRVHALRGGRRARRRATRATSSTGSHAVRADLAGDRCGSAPGARGELGRGDRRSRRRGSTSCGSASRSTASRRRPVSAPTSVCGPRSRCARRCRT